MSLKTWYQSEKAKLDREKEEKEVRQRQSREAHVESFRKEAFESVESKVKESLLKSGPRFTVSFSSEAVSTSDMRDILTQSVEAFFKKEGVSYQILKNEVGTHPREFYDEHLHDAYVFGHLEGRVFL